MRLAPFSNRNSIWSAIRPARRRGVVLLEVVVALVLFVGATAVITAGLNASLNSIERLRLNTQAANLAVSVLSELQMGIKSLSLSGPQPFDPPDDQWTWEILATPADEASSEASDLKKIEVIIRHDEPASVYRLSQVLRIEETNPANETGALGDGPPF